MMSQEQQLFWRRMDEVNAGMLGTRDRLKLVPMSHYTDAHGLALWFITAQGTDLVAELADGPKPAIHVVGEDSEGLWARIEGQLELSDDREKLDEIWNSTASAWFEGGQEDPDLRLLKFSITEAEIWNSTGGLGFLYQIAKANLTGTKPDIANHFLLRF